MFKVVIKDVIKKEILNMKMLILSLMLALSAMTSFAGPAEEAPSPMLQLIGKTWVNSDGDRTRTLTFVNDHRIIFTSNLQGHVAIILNDQVMPTSFGYEVLADNEMTTPAGNWVRTKKGEQIFVKIIDDKSFESTLDGKSKIYKLLYE